MHTSESYNSNVPAFLMKLWKLVEDSSCNDLISWSENGRSFIIRDQAKFAKELLPLYFKHSNMASFIRQLNMYGFRKVANYEKSGLKAESDEMEFHHLFFVRGEASLLALIKRKMPSTKGSCPADNPPRSPNAKELLNDLTSIRKKQENMDQMLLNMKKENEILWQEISVLRNKHKTQEQIIQKVIHFLVSLVRDNQSVAPKRKLPRLLHDNGPKNKTMKLPPKLGLIRSEGSPLCFSVLSDKLESQSPQGPVIHEVTDFDIDEEVETPAQTELGDNLLLNENYPIVTSSSPVEPEKMESEQTEGSVEMIEMLSPPELEPTSPAGEELSTITEKVLTPPDELSVITAESLQTPECDASEQPVLISLNFDIGSDSPVPLNTEVLTSPEGCFVVQNSENSDAEVPTELPTKENLTDQDIAAGETETEQIVNAEVIDNIVGTSAEDIDNIVGTAAEDIDNIVGTAAEDIDNIVTAAEDITNYSSLFGGSAKDVLLCNNTSEDDEIGNQENNCNNLQLALSEPNSSTSGLLSKEDISDHLCNIEHDLEWLQSQLRSGSLNIDSSTLLGVCQRWESRSSFNSQLFSAEDVLNNSLLISQFNAENSDLGKEAGNDITGNEIVQFTTMPAYETDLNSIENPILQYLEDVPLDCTEPEANELKCDADGDASNADSIKVNFQALMDNDSHCNTPTKSGPTRKKKRPQRVK